MPTVANPFTAQEYAAIFFAGGLGGFVAFSTARWSVKRDRAQVEHKIDLPPIQLSLDFPHIPFPDL
jgi:hypothetical protein